jgi:beta-aspartyl-peptidase (threonine type)
MQSLPAIAGAAGSGGLIAVDRQGHVSLCFNTEGMYRGCARGAEAPFTAIHR